MILPAHLAGVAERDVGPSFLLRRAEQSRAASVDHSGQSHRDGERHIPAMRSGLASGELCRRLGDEIDQAAW